MSDCPVQGQTLLGYYQLNRVKLYPGKVNKWVIATVLPPEEAAGKLGGVLSHWFAGSPLDSYFGDAGRAVDAVRIVGASASPPKLSSSAQTAAALKTPPTLGAPKGSPLTYLSVTFNYRGAPKDMGWPVYSEASFWQNLTGQSFEANYCPVGAQWMLQAAAGKPSALADAPAEADPLEKLAAGSGARELAKGAQSLVTYAKWGVGIYLAIEVMKTVRAVAPIASPAAARRRRTVRS